MDFCHLIVTCLFSMLRLPFDNQKVKGNYAIFLENISTFLKKDNRLLKKDKGVLKKGQHVSAYMPIMFSVHYSITKPIFFLLHLSFHLIKNTQSIKRLKLEPLPLTPVSTVSVSAILSCRPFFILIFLPCIKMKHYGFSRKGG